MVEYAIPLNVVTVGWILWGLVNLFYVILRWFLREDLRRHERRIGRAADENPQVSSSPNPTRDTRTRQGSLFGNMLPSPPGSSDIKMSDLDGADRRLATMASGQVIAKALWGMVFPFFFISLGQELPEDVSGPLRSLIPSSFLPAIALGVLAAYCALAHTFSGYLAFNLDSLLEQVSPSLSGSDSRGRG